MKRPSHLTQWAAQFAVASELCKRGYQVALTHGNHPSIDLMVRSPQGAEFDVDVKGLYKKNFFLLSPKDDRKNLFYILACVPQDNENQFFVLSQAEANKEVQQDIERARARQISKGNTGENAGVMPGISWAAAQRYKDRWKETLPQ
ncbi:MAG TPA: hypothetical protein VNZ48_18075 [Xanthobacteraceae bacterium]|jgi:hypothetical protein|nr:hypothetical protein [Xanthobacteraceae bacterium]